MADKRFASPGPPREIKRRVEAAIVALLLGLLRLLPVAAASAMGGAVARSLGPRLSISRRARLNLARAMPELDAAAIDTIVRDMWDNLGRVAGEMPHLADFRIATKADRPGTIELVGAEHAEGLGRDGRGALFFAGHIANWEIQPLTITLAGIDLNVVYRPANNPFVDRMIARMRGPIASEAIAKGPAGARRLLTLLKDGHAIGMLVDQKMNDGIAVPFFGRPAMTAPALAQFALKFNAPIIPVTCERLEGPRFRVTFEAPLPMPRTGDREAAVSEIMTAVNARLEAWIRRRPAQWLWLHRRWPD